MLTASSRMLRAMATSRSDSRAVYTASGIVCVTPGRLPAKVIVAPNSPSARAQQSTPPATMDGADHRQGHPTEDGPRRGAEGDRGVLVAAVE